MPKRGRNEPKAKGPHHHLISKILCFQKNFYPLVSYCVQNGEKVEFQKITSWTLRGGSLLGGVLFSQRKSIWKKGRKFRDLKMFCKLLLIYLWLFAKRTLKRFYKNFCKIKTCGASVVQNVKNKETIHAYLVNTLNWLNSKQPLHLYHAN
jgi:hypothetical protein